jgi:cell division control protein 6
MVDDFRTGTSEGVSTPMATFASLRKQLEKAKEKHDVLMRERAKLEARDEASQIFKTVTPEPTAGKGLFQGESSVFADLRWLQPTSEPPDGFPFGREEYVNSLSLLLAPALRGGAGRNVYIAGVPGTGKTLTVRYVLGELNRHVRNAGLAVHVAYVNAGRTRSPYFTLLEIARSMGVDAPASGWQFSRLKMEFEARRGSEPMVVAIDEADALLFKVREPLIYYLNRQEKMTMVLISNRWDDLAGLPPRARSTLQLAPLIFKPYNAEEAKHILQARADRAFKAGAIDDEILDSAAALAEEMHDIRVGFNLLLTAGLLTEGQGRSKVDLVDLKRAEAAIQPTI